MRKLTTQLMVATLLYVGAIISPQPPCSSWERAVVILRCGCVRGEVGVWAYGRGLETPRGCCRPILHRSLRPEEKRLGTTRTTQGVTSSSPWPLMALPLLSLTFPSMRLLFALACAVCALCAAATEQQGHAQQDAWQSPLSKTVEIASGVMMPRINLGTCCGSEVKNAVDCS
jgi:hypothetical protein